jgi:uncharacterized membrane protein YdjX (TVP38/TMEM64 family)
MTEHSPALRRRLRYLLAALAFLLCLALAWAWSPLKSWLDVDLMVATLQGLGRSFGPVAAVAGFALAVSLAVPLSFLTLVTLVALGPWLGCACTMVGGVIGAAVSYGVGTSLGHEVVQRLGSERVNALSQRLARRGVLAIVAVRLVPIAPFAIVNMIAGASHIRLRDFLLGTAIGMTPGTLMLMLFTNQILQALKQPTTLSFALLALTVALIALGLWGVRRWARS